jgi:hypothetical protein
MKYQVTVTAAVQYICTLSPEDSEIVKEFLEENPNYSEEDAVIYLYGNNKIGLYDYESTESDFSIESVDMVEELEEEE